MAQRGSGVVTRERSGGCFNEEFSSLFVNWGTKDYVNVGLLPREEKIKQTSRRSIVVFAPVKQRVKFSSYPQVFIHSLFLISRRGVSVTFICFSLLTIDNIAPSWQNFSL